MRISRLARLVMFLTLRIVPRPVVCKIVSRLEGGQLYSTSLRVLLHRWYGVVVGDYSYGSLLAPGNADPHTEIGRYVSVGPNVRRIGAAHPLELPSLHPFWYNPKLGYVNEDADVPRNSCTIGHDSWIGANAVILPGCRRIGVGAVVGAGSVVNRDVEDFEVVAGVPVKHLRFRLDPNTRGRLLASRWWELDPLDAQVVLRELLDE